MLAPDASLLFSGLGALSGAGVGARCLLLLDVGMPDLERDLEVDSRD